ncbi:hypothetical protein JQ594_31925 [Bradyrhizobium manausense]|uniref:hypothetical protein n=1 Tax=Bradyrhizobium manausense TaxID=989370 RepID=UPI001BA48D5D|nr:hypothetical protein [Bradyrhizobium manausense]MBR0690557.1 hypothetical protein [Bradyrhizobium manausense]
MRILAIAAAVLALTVASAQAQMGGGRRHANEGGAKADSKPKVDEKAYKAALERIPESKERYDPWSGARPSEPAKKPK